MSSTGVAKEADVTKEDKKQKKKGNANKKGVNPLKAKLKAARGGPDAAATSAAASDDREKSRTSPEGLIANDAATLRASEPSFTVQIAPPVLTLLFKDRSAQHAAMARMEAFYESSGNSRKYLTLEEARLARICAHYEAFNLPVSALLEWLLCMVERETGSCGKGDEPRAPARSDGQCGSSSTPWLEDAINLHEGEVLRCFESHGIVKSHHLHVTGHGSGGRDNEFSKMAPPTTEFPIEQDGDAGAGSLPAAGIPAEEGQHDQLQKQPSLEKNGEDQPRDGRRISYIVSCLAHQASKSLPHERLHALYHLSPEYRRTVAAEYAALSKKPRKAIETELSLRGYGSQVWEDEWQAYVVDVEGGESLGGGVAKAENAAARVILQKAARDAWAAIAAE